MRIGRTGARRYYTNSSAPGSAHKIFTDITPMLPPFYRGKMSRILAQISTPVVFGPPYFGTEALYRKTKTNLSRADDRSTTIPNVGLVGPPNPRTVGTMGTQKSKSGKFLYILYSSGPRRVQRHQCYTTCWGCTCCKKLPCHISQFAPTVHRVHRRSPKWVKVENLLYILRFTPSTSPPMLYHLLGP